MGRRWFGCDLAGIMQAVSPNDGNNRAPHKNTPAAGAQLRAAGLRGDQRPPGADLATGRCGRGDSRCAVGRRARDRDARLRTSAWCAVAAARQARSPEGVTEDRADQRPDRARRKGRAGAPRHFAGQGPGALSGRQGPDRSRCPGSATTAETDGLGASRLSSTAGPGSPTADAPRATAGSGRKSRAGQEGSNDASTSASAAGPARAAEAAEEGVALGCVLARGAHALARPRAPIGRSRRAARRPGALDAHDRPERNARCRRQRAFRV